MSKPKSIATRLAAATPSSDPAYEACLLGMIARAEHKFEGHSAAYVAAREAGVLVPSLAEQRRDKLVARGLDRAARSRHDNVPGVSWWTGRATPWRIVPA